MKTEEEIRDAFDKVYKQASREDISLPQKAILVGMMNALAWCRGGTADTLQSIVDGKPVEASN